MQQIKSGGYHIYTTIDVKVQEQVDKIYTDLSQIPDTRGGQQLQSAIVVIDNSTGDIVAMAGGVGEKTGFDDWNRATDAKLQSGSSIKPISIYAPGFEQGTISPATVIKDLPLMYNDGPWPRNDNYKYAYSSTILSGVIRSVNTVAANTLDKIGTSYGYDFAKNKFGISSLVDEYVDANGTVHTDNGFAPLAMGAQTWGVHVRDMAGAYATFANNGVRRQERTFTKVYDSEGNLVIDNVQKQEQILSQKSVNYMNYCLVNATASGTGTEANFSGMEVAGKTGSTSAFKDRWYCGFTGYYTAAVWTGFDTPEVIRPTTCNNPASVLFRRVMKPLHDNLSYKDLYSTSGMVSVSVCLDSGLRATSACSKDSRGISRVASALVYPEDVPSGFCDKHVSVEVCSGGGTPNEWCKKFAAEDPSVTIGTASAFLMTSEEYNEAAKAVAYGLSNVYISNVAVNSGSTTKVCTKHTQAAWEEYLASKVTEPSESVPPEGGEGGTVTPPPTTPTTPSVPAA